MSKRSGPFASNADDPDRTDEFPTVGSTQNVQQGPKRPQLPRLSSGQQGQHAQPKKRKFQRVQQQAQPQSQPVQAVAQPQQDPKDQEIEQLKQQMARQEALFQQMLQQQAAAQNNVGSNQNSPAQAQPSVPQQKPQTVSKEAKEAQMLSPSTLIEVQAQCMRFAEVLSDKEKFFKGADKIQVLSIQGAAKKLVDSFEKHESQYNAVGITTQHYLQAQVLLTLGMEHTAWELANKKEEEEKLPLTVKIQYTVAVLWAVFTVYALLAYDWRVALVACGTALFIGFSDIEGTKIKYYLNAAKIILGYSVLGLVGIAVCVVMGFKSSDLLGMLWKNWSRPAAVQKKEGETGAPQGAPVGPPSGATTPNTFPFQPDNSMRQNRSQPPVRHKRVRTRRRSRPRSRRPRVRRRRSRSRWSGSAMIRSTKWTRIGRTSKRVHSLCFSKRVASVRILIKGSKESIATGRFVRRSGCKSAYLFFAQQSGSIYVYASGSYPLRVRISR